MTITKKLLLIGACIIGIQSNSYSNHTAVVAYQDNSRQVHVSEILSFAQTLRHLNNKKALSLAQWLETQAISGQSKLNDQDIATITQVVINNRLTTLSKCNILTKAMEQQIAHERKNCFRKAVDAVYIASVATIHTGITALAIYQAITNPAPRIVVQENAFGVSYSPSSGWSLGYSLGYYYPSLRHLYPLGTPTQIIVI